MIPIPAHLSAITTPIKAHRNAVTLAVKCSRCGDTFFFLFESHPAAQEDAAVVKAVCCGCGAEYTLFDSRLHGYDAVISDHRDALPPLPAFRQLNLLAAPLSIHIENDAAPDEFPDEQEHANAFAWITITGRFGRFRKKVLFDRETA